MAFSFRAQASSELIMVMGISLIVLLVVITISSGFLLDIAGQKGFQEASSSVQKLASAADTVYAQGEGAWTTVLVTIPTDANMSPDVSFIGKPASASSGMPSNLINLRVKGSDVFAGTRASVVGSFPTAPGTYSMRVLSAGSYVIIGVHFFDVNKGSIFQSMARGENRSENITITAVGNESVRMNITLDWRYAGAVNMSASSLVFNVSAGSSTQVKVSMNATQAAAGIYSDRIIIIGTSNSSGVVETVIVPVTVDVQT